MWGLLRGTREERASFDATRLAGYPPPFPSAWYRVADARDLRARKPLRVSIADDHLVLFRDASGKARALDARCPHLGADLSAGSVVEGCLECPLHRWRFRGDGSVAHIPYQATIPAALGARSWPVCELAGMIFVYRAHFAEDRRAPPPYELPRLPDDFVFRGRRDLGVVRMHLVELAENGADAHHFDSLHDRMTIPWTQLHVPGMKIEHRTEWTADATHPHLAHLRNVATLFLGGRRLARTTAETNVVFVGPGTLAIFRFALPGIGDVMLFQTHTAVAPMRVHVGLRWFAEPRVPRLLVSYCVGSWASQLARDVHIWERKSYVAKPMLVENDGPLRAFRQWYRQFYEREPARCASAVAPSPNATIGTIAATSTHAPSAIASSKT